jgi:hypothetical protein
MQTAEIDSAAAAGLVHAPMVRRTASAAELARAAVGLRPQNQVRKGYSVQNS